MQSDRTIGRTVKIKTYQALVELSSDTSSYVKSSYGGLYAIAVINSFVIIPVGSERVVAIVTGLDMAEEPEATMQNRQMLVIGRPRRTMWVSMIGTITQSVNEKKQFEYGVRRYPELDNPVWFASEEDLDVIFDKRAGATEKGRITIGTSPLFPDYQVTIDMDRFFGKHAAILGNTGTGKSCTVTAVIRAVLDAAGGMPNAHFIIFDTNNEYERAFTNPDGSPMYDRLILRNEGDQPTGLWIPHWFMNGSDYHAFFRPGEGAQAPLLFKSIAVARAQSQIKSMLLDVLGTLEDAASQIQAYVSNPPVGAAAYYGKKNLRDLVDSGLGVLEKRESALSQGSLDIAVYRSAFNQIGESAEGDGNIDAQVNDTVREQCQLLREAVTSDRNRLVGNQDIPVGVDSPVHFDFDEFVNSIFQEELARESQRDPRLRGFVGTLQLRLEQARQDPRYAFLFKVQPFRYALASFLRLLIGVDPTRHFDKSRPPWADTYEQQYTTSPTNHQVTILDLSELASEVLENVTALLGRLIFEFMQRNPRRGEFPVVLVLEEAHHYISSHVTSERQQRAREVFEKIAKEGRKFGLSLVVASQRPSELSRTVLAQCNSFIVHRIQNPDDQEYFKSVISGINRELLGQLPSLAQQQALVLGDCVTLPLQVRINDIEPTPHSYDPRFFGIWSDKTTAAPDFEAIAARWQGHDEAEDEASVPETKVRKRGSKSARTGS
jgi:uncharacterized protein DUF87